MEYIERNSYSTDEIVDHLNGIKDHLDGIAFSLKANEQQIRKNLQVRKAKDAEKIGVPYHEHGDIKHPSTGDTLQPVKGYYIGNVCIYAEYQGADGTSYCYTAHRDASVSDQIRTDVSSRNVYISTPPEAEHVYSSRNTPSQVSTVQVTQKIYTESKVASLKTVRSSSDENIKLDSGSFKQTQDAVEAFIMSISRNCEELDRHVQSMKSHLKDDKSIELLKKALRVTVGIRTALEPAKKINSKLEFTIQEMSKIDQI